MQFYSRMIKLICILILTSNISTRDCVAQTQSNPSATLNLVLTPKAEKKPTSEFVQILKQRIYAVWIGESHAANQFGYQPWVRIQGSVFKAFDLEEGGDHETNRNPVLREQGPQLLSFDVEWINKNQFKAQGVLVKYKNDYAVYTDETLIDESDLFNYVDIDFARLEVDHSNPLIKTVQIDIGALMGHAFVLQNEENWIGTEATIRVGGGSAIMDVQSASADQNVPSGIRTLTLAPYSLILQVQPGLHLKQVLPGRLELNARTGLYYSRTTSGVVDGELEKHQQGMIDKISTQLTNRYGYLAVIIDRPFGPNQKRVGLFFDGQFFRRLKGQKNDLGVRMNLTPLAPPVPFQVGVKAQF